MKPKYSRGSEWRKWDLHVHTPASALNNQFEGINEEEKWDKYLAKLASLTGISVLGLTDYFSLEGYKKVKAYKDTGHLSNIDFLLPNVELRILPVTSEDTPINLHIIFSPEIAGELDSKFFSSLEFTYQGEVFKCIRENLIKLARKYKNDNNLLENMAYKTGIEQFRISFEKIKEVIERDKLLQNKSIVLVSNKSSDGVSGIQHSSLAATREGIYRFAHCIFSSSPNDRAYFLGKGSDSPEEIIRKYVSLKPCVHGSDAHALDKICNPDLGRYTWVKSDPTFEGLKQIIYEPEDRVYIGEEPPSKIDKSKIIKSITVASSNRWFEDNKPFELNEGLVSIIGGKGTGKTALIDLIAYAAQSYRRYRKKGGESKSFLEKAFKELKGVTIKLQWADHGRPDEKEVGDKLEDFIEEGKVRYLPQDFIEELCTELGKENLEKQIENEIIEIEKGISKLDEEMNKISSSIKDADDQKKIINDLSDINNKKTNIEKEISGLNTKLLKIDDVKNKISVFAEYAEGFVEEVKGDLKSIQIPQEVIESIKVKLEPDNAENLLDNKKQEIVKEIETKKKELDGYNENIQGLNKNLKLEKTKQDKIKEINSSLSQQKEKLSSLKEGFKNIEESEKSLQGLLNKRESLFINFFEILFEEKEKLKAIYSPLENILKQSTEENERLFDFSVQFSFDVKEIAEKGDKFIDHTKEGRFWRKTEQALVDEIEQLKFSLNLEDEVISSGDKETVKKYLLNVENLFLKDENGREFKIFAQLKKGTEKDFYDWLYLTDYYSVVYSIRFNDTDIDNLSPGLKGVALLVLYLDLDKEDTRPILIDQPEENLDNRSVYKTLKRYFREAKRNRQVIIVTHNPNIVVNTDSEQVIVADFDRGLTKQQSRIYYVSGSLENTFKSESNIDLEKQGIREHVCEILEGGKEAFEKRERKYGFKS